MYTIYTSIIHRLVYKGGNHVDNNDPDSALSRLVFYSNIQVT